MRGITIVFVASVWLLAACSRAEGTVEGPPEEAAMARVESVTGPLSFNVVTESGVSEIRLAMLETPDGALSQSVLADLLASETVWIDPVRDDPDRYGRIIARIWLGEAQPSELLQVRLLESGAARVLAYPDNGPQEIESLLAVEAQARVQGHGLWGNPDHAIRDTDPDMLTQDTGVLQLVEGRIVTATELSSGRVYLNFGSDWRTDFTIRIDEADRPVFEAAGIDLAELEGYRVRVRGIIRSENGPMVRLNNPMRLEVLTD